MKKFDLRIFMIATIVMMLLNFLSWTGLEAHDTLNTTHTLLGIVGSFWTILRYPTFTYFWRFIYGVDNVIVYSIAVFINCIFYAVLVERINYLFNKKTKSTLVYNK